MPAVDWERICRSAGIDFNKTAASTSRGYINIHCPMCGESDKDFHMGLHRSGRWSCFRDSVGHRGRDPRRILALVLRCSYEEARVIIGEEDVGYLSDFNKEAIQFLSDEDRQFSPKLAMPDNFRPLVSNRGRARIYWRYLKDRSPSGKSAAKISSRYNMHYCDQGVWRGRIILPITIDGELLSWVGRTVYETEKIRYKNLTHREDADIHGRASTRDLLYNFDNAIRARSRVCVVTEGPFDAIRVDWCGRKHGITAVATFGAKIGKSQLELLDQIRDNCDHLVICGDKNAEANVMDIHSATIDLGTKVIDLPRDVEDPGVLTESQVRELFGSL